ncbi:MAG: AAA family ATPase, partial [Desulfohalobiaceae bacterium]
MSKKPLEGLGDKFSPRILLYGDPGSGKTTFAGSYTKGPIHIYSFDPEGLTVLRENTNSITADEYLDQNYKKKGEAYSAFWEQLRKDESDGFFQEMRGQEGLVVFDSYTTLENYLVDYVALRVLMKKPNKDGVYLLERPDWPKVTPYVLNFFKAVTALP